MDIDEELKAAGLLTVSELMAGQPIDGFKVHAGVESLETFLAWLDMRTKEIMSMRARLTLDDRENEELFEWVLAHSAAFQEVRTNLRAALAAN